MKKRSIWQKKWLWPFAAFLSLAFVIHAQDNSKAKEPAKFGVGIAYGFKDQVKQFVHPVEFTLRYNLSPKHSIRINVPLAWNNNHERDHYRAWSPVTEDDYVVEGYFKDKIRLFGLGFGYDYSIATYKNLDLIAGGGLEYQRFYHFFRRVEEGIPFPFLRCRYNDYSLYPQVGLRYAWKFVGVELDYRCYFTLRGERWDYEQYSYLHNPMNYDTHINHAFRCGLFFLF